MPIDADLIQRCADPSLTPAIVESFVKSVGSDNPLSVTVRNGNRVILVSPAKSSMEALKTIRTYIGQAVVRVGVTQYPAGIGVDDPAEISPDLLDACSNVRQGTALFGKVWRIVLKWYGYPTDGSIMPQVLDDALEAWKTGRFDGVAVFTAEDPGAPHDGPKEDADLRQLGDDQAPVPYTIATQPDQAGIRVDLSSIGGPSP
jgi:hypothetical protein